MNWFSFRWPAIAIAACLAIGALAQACNVPVFRFALERWRPDSYRAVLFHRGPLTAAEQNLIRPLAEHHDKRLANLSFHAFDLDDAAADSGDAVADRELFAALGSPSLPRLVIQYPAQLKISQPAWSGHLSPEFVATTLDSPLRQELASRLAAGQTAVWLLLESGQPAQDDAVAERLETQLRELEQQLELPELSNSPEDALATTLPLELKFSILRIPRDVPAEHALVATLIGSEPDLAERSDPMLFPVFGRGRALFPLIGAGINTKNIHDAAAFLAGACSCEVKEQNPGFDLLLAVDWLDLLADKGIALTALEATSQPLVGDLELVPIPTGVPQPPIAPTTLAAGQSNLPAAPPWWAVSGAFLGVVALFAGAIVALAQLGRQR